MKQQNEKGVTGLQLFFCIFGIFLFLSLIFLPPIFRTLKLGTEDSYGAGNSSLSSKEEIEVRCYRNLGNEEQEYFLSSKANQFSMIALTDTKHYDEITSEIDQECSLENSRFFENEDVVYHECQISGNDMILLSRVTFEGNVPENLPFSLEYKKGASFVRQSLESEGFSCKEENS